MFNGDSHHLSTSNLPPPPSTAHTRFIPAFVPLLSLSVSTPRLYASHPRYPLSPNGVVSLPIAHRARFFNHRTTRFVLTFAPSTLSLLHSVLFLAPSSYIWTPLAARPFKLFTSLTSLLLPLALAPMRVIRALHNPAADR